MPHSPSSAKAGPGRACWSDWEEGTEPEPCVQPGWVGARVQWEGGKASRAPDFSSQH